MLSFSGDEEQRRGIHAVAQTSWLRPIREDVPQVRVAKGAFDFRPQYARAKILFLVNIFRGDGFPKARPARPGFELHVRIKERVAAIHAAVQPRRVLMVERPRESKLGRRAPRYIILQRRELLLPVGFAL